MKGLVGLILLILALPGVFADDMTLLAVSESDDGLRGSTATISLEVIEGQGRIFLETQPLTKTDTQVSTRFSAQVACGLLNRDCSDLDFIYTMKSTAPLVGGPSAGGAMTILTLGSLLDLELSDDVAITGTINSGGIIGPVGGVKEKIDAAVDNGIRTVLIPIGDRFHIDNETLNLSTDLVEYGDDLGVDVVEVGLVSEAFSYFTGDYEFEEIDGELVENEDYTRIMKGVADDLCDRTDSLLSQVDEPNNVTEELIEEAEDALDDKTYYSAASRCFVASIELSNQIEEGLTEDVLGEKLNRLEDNVDSFSKTISEREVKTIPQLQTRMIVEERLREAKEIIDTARDSELEDGISQYAFARERFSSAVSWSAFYEMPGSEVDLDEDVLKRSCSNKLFEVSERIQYIQSITPLPMDGITEMYETARDQAKDKDYTLCLHSASLAKARADVVLGSMGVRSEEQMINIAELKLEVAEKNIIAEQNRGLFPLAGYSYYQYSQTLIEDSPATALLFSQYALELSSFDEYFAAEQVEVHKKPFELGEGFELFFVYVFGLLSGVIVAVMVLGRK